MSKPDFSEFSKPTVSQWQERAILELKGKSYDETLTWVVSEGVSIGAFHQTYVMSADELSAIQNAQRKTAGWEYVIKSQKPLLSEKEEPEMIYISGESTTFKQLGEVLKESRQIFDFDEASKENASVKMLVITVPVGVNYFLYIALIRAMRYIVNRLSDIYEIKITIKIRSIIDGIAYKTDNPHINIVRATTMAMSAIVGGCDYLEITPFDENDSDFGQRIARNTSILLEEEAFFDKVADTAAGSYFIENLTFILIQKTWKDFLSDNGTSAI